jgi:NAD(P)-dependent dehydrogenase (short-subunit alcohol dehydrogenase family)
MASLQGRHALVTGGGRGIGRAIAAALTGAGAVVTVVGRNEETLRETAAAGDASAWIVADVTIPDRLADGLGPIAAVRGPVDILVANAGGAESARFTTCDPALFRRMFELNVMSAVHATRAVLGDMVARGFGRVVAVASTAGLKGYAYVSAYCAAKHAVVGLVRALAIETAKTGVTVNAVCPGYTDTDLTRDSVEQIMTKTDRSRDEVLGVLLQANPQGRLVKPEEVAAAVLFLCSPGAAAITGAVLPVAGGEV